jgi:hypothetical protein
MPRTPDQIKYDDELTEVIQRCWRAYYEDEEGDASIPEEARREGVMMEYLVIGSMQTVDAHGDRYTRVFTLVKDGDQSLHRMLGLVEFAATQYRQTIVEE